MQDREQDAAQEGPTGQGEAAMEAFDAAPEASDDERGDAAEAVENLAQLQVEYRRMAGPLAAVAKIKPTDPRALGQLATALERLPSGVALGQALEELRERTTRFAQAARRERIATFRPIEAEWVRAARAAGQSVRERSSGWRVGMLELALQREQARARFFYNREALTPWSPIGDPTDLAALEERARTLLRGVALQDELLIAVFHDAYEGARAARQRDDRGRAEVVPLPDFYRGVRVALVRHEVAEQGPEKKLRWAELPRWAFLHNLDRYRALGTTVPEKQRLGLQTGSQQETRQFGMVVNGLDATQDYKTMCFVVPFGGERGGA